MLARYSHPCRIWDKNTIDLHGLTLHHAQTVVREGVTSWWASCEPPVSLLPRLSLSLTRRSASPRLSLHRHPTASPHHHRSRPSLDPQQSHSLARHHQAVGSRGLAVEVGFGGRGARVGGWQARGGAGLRGVEVMREVYVVCGVIQQSCGDDEERAERAARIWTCFGRGARIGETSCLHCSAETLKSPKCTQELTPDTMSPPLASYVQRPPSLPPRRA